MDITWEASKDRSNRQKHGLGLGLSRNVFDDPLVAVVYDRFENGEHRYHAIGMVGWKCLLVVHTYPDADDESRIRAIGLREATSYERNRYEKGDF